ncbi:26306_t:CDS:2, partial [Racocetra persica]
QDSEQVPVENEIVQYLSLPYTGFKLPSEQAFSVATNTITKIRYNLKPDTVHAAMCLKSWIQQIRDKKEKEIDIENFFLLE